LGVRKQFLLAVASLAATIASGCARPIVAGAAASAELRVLVYNVHAGKDAKGVDNLQRVADVVRGSDADIVLLQEVDKGTRRSGNVDQPAEYARRTGFNVAFGRSLNYDGGEYGIAILSRWPIRSDTTIHLPVAPPQERSGGSYEPRVAMRVTIGAPAGDIVVMNTHLDASGEDVWRKQEVRTLIDLTRAATAGRAVAVFMGGDLNSTPESAVQESIRSAGFRDAWQLCGAGEGLSYPADVPRKRIDYLYLASGAECTKGEVVVTEASDHRPVLVRVRLRR
jgi:endonuclease/exonuclease/phosphatase family metal-dependent hydrolase